MNIERSRTDLGFARVASITPGSCNLVVMASAGAFG